MPRTSGHRGMRLDALIAAMAIIKIAILWLVGPSTSPDTGGYVDFADVLVLGHGFAPVAWGPTAVPNLVFRTAGYPLVLAAAKLTAPGSWAPLVILFQAGLDMVATILIFRVAERLLGSRGWAFFAVLLYLCSAALLWDNSLLPDSLYSSLFNIVIFSLLGGLLGCWQLSAAKVCGLAVLWGYSLWTRDNGLYFTLLPLLLLWVIDSETPSRRRRRIVTAGIFAAVVAAMVGAYATFNLHRTGEAFFSLTGEENYLRPLFDMRRYGYADPFTGDDLVARTVRETMTAYDFPAQLQFYQALHQRCACTPTRIQAMAFSGFVSGVVQHPIAYARVVIRNFNYFDLASDIFDPVSTINQFTEYGTQLGVRVVPGLSMRHIIALYRQFSVTMLVMMTVAGVTKVTSAMLFTLFVIGVPWLWLRQRETGRPAGRRLQTAAFLWLSFMAVAAAFSLVHFEPRHALPVFPAAQLGMVYLLAWMAQRRGLWRDADTPVGQAASAP